MTDKKQARGRPPGPEPRKRAKRRPKLTAADLPRVRALIAANPESTCASIAALLHWNRGNLGRFAAKHGLIFPRRLIGHPVRATGMTGDLLRKLDEQKVSQLQLSKELQVDPTRIARWRSGESEPTLFMAVCMAELAGCKLVLEPVSDLTSQVGRQ